MYNQVQRKSATFVLQFFVFLFAPFILEDFFTHHFPTLTPFLLKLSKNNFGNIFVCIVNSRDLFFMFFVFSVFFLQLHFLYTLAFFFFMSVNVSKSKI